jgi:hypothetical protein
LNPENLAAYNAVVTSVFTDPSRVDWAVLVDTSLTPFPGSTKISADGLHYTTEGHQQLAYGWAKKLGYI